jgi:hypothetical protein
MALLLPTNVSVDIYRGFSASIPYPVASTPAAMAQAAGRIEQNIRLGRFGHGQFLHWTHVLYLPPGTDVRSAYNSLLNSWPAAQADTITIADYPIPGWCTAFLVVLVQRIGRGTPGDCLRVYLDRVQPRQGACQQGHNLRCCPNPLPDTVHATIRNVSGCACLDGEVVALTFESLTSRWVGDKDICGSHPISLGFDCGVTSCDTASVTTIFDSINQTTVDVLPGCSCSPLNMVFDNLTLTDTTSCPDAIIQYTITL